MPRPRAGSPPKRSPSPSTSRAGPPAHARRSLRTGPRQSSRTGSAIPAPSERPGSTTPSSIRSSRRRAARRNSRNGWCACRTAISPTTASGRSAPFRRARRWASPKTPSSIAASTRPSRSIARSSRSGWTCCAPRPRAVLWLKDDNRWATAAFKEHARAAGIDPARLVFGASLPLPEHLARLTLADLALDCAPYGSHTTASDALWAGVPHIAYRGDTFAARVSASLVTAIGLPELIVRSPEEYRALGSRLANDRDALVADQEPARGQSPDDAVVRQPPVRPPSGSRLPGHVAARRCWLAARPHRNLRTASAARTPRCGCCWCPWRCCRRPSIARSW